MRSLHWLKKPADEPSLTPKTRRLLFLESFLGNFLFTLCMIYGVSLTSAVSAGVIMASIPAVVALMSWVFLRERIGLRICHSDEFDTRERAQDSPVIAPHDAQADQTCP